MKKLTLLLLLLICGLSQAQISVTTYGAMEETIEDGDVFDFNTTEENEATLYFYIHNESDEAIDVRVRCNEIENANGEDFQFCFGGLCIFQVTEDRTYPYQDIPVTIEPGETNVEYDKFYNENPGDGENYPISYNFTIFQVDENDNEIGDPISFTYRYDPGFMSTEEYNLDAMGIDLYNTVTQDEVNVKLDQPAEAKLYDLNGRLVQSYKLATGTQAINVANLSANVYIIQFVTEDGKKAASKIVKK